MLPTLSTIQAFLAGKKTYLAAAVFFGLALLALANGDYQQAVTQAGAGLALVGLRSALFSMLAQLLAQMAKGGSDGAPPMPPVAGEATVPQLKIANTGGYLEACQPPERMTLTSPLWDNQGNMKAA